MERLKEMLNERNELKILDVGTGAGNFVHLITSLYDGYDSIVGVDTSARAIEMAGKHFSENPRVTFRVTDGSLKDFKDQSFDVVCLSNSVHHLEYPDNLFNEMKRVVKADGYILINEMISSGLDARQESHKKLHHFAAEIDRAVGDFHDETYSEKQLLDVLSKYSEKIDYWVMDVERVTENTEEQINWMMDTIDRVLKRTETLGNHNYFVSKAEEIKKYIKTNGYDGATSILATLKK